MVTIRETKYVILITLLILLNSCSYQWSRSDSEDSFYRGYPELQGNIRNLRASIENIPIREIARYARFEIQESLAQEFLKKHKYVQLESVSKKLSSPRLDLNLNQIIETKCDKNFILFKGQSKHYLTWWDLKQPPEKSCYIRLPDVEIKQYRAIYDRSRGVMYLYTFKTLQFYLL